MVRIKKEKYKKIQQKREAQILEEQVSIGIDQYIQDHEDFVRGLYQFYWEYEYQVYFYEHYRKFAESKPLLVYSKDGTNIENEQELFNTIDDDELLNDLSFGGVSQEAMFAKIQPYVNYWLYHIIPMIDDEFRTKIFYPFLLTQFDTPVQNVSCMEYFIYQEYLDRFWEHLKNHLQQYNILFVDFKQFDIQNNLFDLFKLIEDAHQYRALFIKDIDYQEYRFLIDFGIEKKVKNLCCFGSVKDAKDYLDKTGETQQYRKKTGFQYYTHVECLDFGELLCEKYNRVGFSLYDNLQEWKKEMNAPTRDDPEYRKMKKRVRARDNNTCQCCGYHSDKKTHHKLEVHHIYGYKDHLDYRTEDSNCIVLCQDCHKKYHSLYGRKDVAPDTFMKFIRDFNEYQNNIQSTLDIFEVK